jgi:hypothetical protein
VLAVSFVGAVWADTLARSDSGFAFVESLLLGFVALGAYGSMRRIARRAVPEGDHA